MDRSSEDPGLRFALKIRSQHPQISYEHAVSAAAYAGVPDLRRGVFFEAVDRLNLPRENPLERLSSAVPATPPSDGPQPESPASSAVGHESFARIATGSGGSKDLIADLDAFRDDLRETGEIRNALQAMRKVVLAALDEVTE